MDREPSQPINTDEAKTRLRNAARRASPSAYVEQHPMQAVGLAMAAGLLAGRLRLPHTVAITLAEQLLPLVIRRTWKQRQAPSSHNERPG